MCHTSEKSRNACGKSCLFRGDKPPDNGDNPAQILLHEIVSVGGIVGKSSVTAVRLVHPADCRDRRLHRLATIARTCAVVVARTRRFRGLRRHRRESRDREAKASALTACNAKFAGRRKPGGGYTYFDFMQDRSFDIAGPNPTPEEQKKIDQQYTEYLDNQRRSSIAAAFAAKQQRRNRRRRRAQPVTLRSETGEGAAAGACAQQARRRGRAQSARQGRRMRAALILLRMAAAFREHQGI